MTVELAARVVPRASARLGGRKTLRVAGIVAGLGAMLGVGGSLLLAALGLTPLVVVSGSMEPGIPVGAVVLSDRVGADEVAVGDVVTTERFNGPGTVTHRVADIVDGENGVSVLTLKGDANDGVDREPYVVSEVGMMRASIPFVGLPQLWVQELFGIDPLT